MEEGPIATPEESRPMGMDEEGRYRIYELSDGRFAIIGADVTERLDTVLPPDAARADYERAVVIPRSALIDARDDIPET